MRYGKWTWEDVIIGIAFAGAVLVWTIGSVKGYW